MRRRGGAGILRRCCVARACTTSAVSSTPSSSAACTEPPALQAVWTAWGAAIVQANSRDACPIPTQGVQQCGAAASFNMALQAHSQLQTLVRQWNADAKVYVCGSVVTQGHLTRHSDIDFVVLPGSGEAQPDRSKQLLAAEGLHRHLARYVPSYMRRQFIALKTARTPVIKFNFNHEPPSRARETTAADAIDDAGALMREVAPAVLASRFEAEVPGREDEVLSRTILVHVRGFAVTREQVQSAIDAAALSGRVTTADVQHNVADVFKHPLGFYTPTTAAEDNNISAQAELTMMGAKSTSTLIRLVGATAVDAIAAVGLFPDGVVIPRVKRDVVTTDVADRRCVPALFRCPWDISFAGFSVANSYLIRYYLLGSHSPPWVHHGALALKRWARCTHVADAQLGMLTPYAVTILWIYFLLTTRHVQWLDPQEVPPVASLPMKPPKLAKHESLMALATDDDLRALGENLAWFFRFYAGPHPEIDERGQGFSRADEIASLNRMRRSTRADVMAWERHPVDGARPGTLWCIEDPYELRGPTEGGLNLGRHLTPEKLDFIQEKVMRALKSMLLHHPDRDSAAADRTILGLQWDEAPAVDGDEH